MEGFQICTRSESVEITFAHKEVAEFNDDRVGKILPERVNQRRSSG
jgi:hypothetical protein